MEKLKESLLENKESFPHENDDDYKLWYDTIRHTVNRYINGSLIDLTNKFNGRIFLNDKHEIMTNIVGDFEYIKDYELMEHIAKKFDRKIQEEGHKILKIKIVRYYAVCELFVVITKKDYVETYSDTLYYWCAGYSNFN